ncbi:sugar ABC transporter ATP-binding protein [Dactylosporangium siamense]|uniref:ABC transporter ATP-binding protein n=1 Tax=Dactylosporangium siamense TaxID=685454 RepID=A0A919PD44_9ACTN|nr:sugar ABC transporter ATP-binding protein [Dactylosporangium siamense]GIG42571.1 ABC transporter ATP-binding protein [Dactylosporangium siamense]
MDQSSDGETVLLPLVAPAPVVVAAGIGKQFGAVRALDGADLTVVPGEIVALAGENGSGKSTLARILAGAVRPDTGRLTVGGRPARFGSPRDALRAGIAMVTQELTCVPAMSVAENVVLPRFTRPAALARRRDAVAAATPHLRRVGLDLDPLTPFSALRQGDRELVEVAKAIATRPRVLILDEATTRLPNPERLFTIVTALADEGVATVFITHRLREIRRLAHRAVVLRDGRLVAELGRDELDDERISSAMVGRSLRDLYAKPKVRVGRPALVVSSLVNDRTPAPVDLTVHAGEVVGLAGLVGAGRSELLESIAGVRPREQGFVTVAGTEVESGSPRSAMRAGIGFVPEDRRAQGLHLDAGIADNLAIVWLSTFGRTDRHLRDLRANRAVNRFKIRCRDIEAPVSHLSGGNQQKVLLAKAVARHPRILLLDEPTRGVDVGAKHEIYTFIGELVTGGIGVLIASSDLLELIGLCDRVLVLHDGAVAGELPRSRATEERIALLSAGGKVT